MTPDPTVLVWNGNEYNLDAQDLTMGEYETIAKRTEPQINGYTALRTGLLGMDHASWKALFFVQDLRRQPALRWTEYDGPTFRTIFEHFDALPADEDDDETAAPLEVVEPGKA